MLQGTRLRATVKNKKRLSDIAIGAFRCWALIPRPCGPRTRRVEGLLAAARLIMSIIIAVLMLHTPPPASVFLHPPPPPPPQSSPEKGGGALEPKSPTVCVPKTAKSICPFVK